MQDGLLNALAGGSVDPVTRELQTAIQKFIVAAASAILYYDYCLTLPREVAWIWQAPTKCSWTSAIFYINRYVLLLGQPAIMFRSFWPSRDPGRLETCVKLGLYRQFFAIAVQLIVSVFMTLRTYALYNFDRRVLTFFVVTLLASLANAISSVVTSERVTYTVADLTLCGCVLPFPDNNARRVGSAWIGLVVFDFLTFLFILRKSLREPRLGSSTIMRLLLRDGAIYFGIMTVLTVATVISYFSHHAYTRGIVSPLTNVVSSCLVSRLILNMRDPSLSSRFTRSTRPGTQDVLSTVQWDPPNSRDESTMMSSAHLPPEEGEKVEEHRSSGQSKAWSEDIILKSKPTVPIDPV